MTARLEVTASTVVAVEKKYDRSRICTMDLSPYYELWQLTGDDDLGFPSEAALKRYGAASRQQVALHTASFGD